MYSQIKTWFWGISRMHFTDLARGEFTKIKQRSSQKPARFYCVSPPIPMKMPAVGIKRNIYLDKMAVMVC